MKNHRKFEKIKLKECLTIRHGKNQFDVQDENGAYPILATGGEIGRARDFLYDKPSVLIGRKGTIDKPQFMTAPFWSIDTLYFSEIKQNYDPKYLYYLFQSINWRSFNEASGVPSLTAKNIENIEVSIASSLSEQRRIAAILTDLDDLIETQEALIAKKKAIREATMELLMTGRKRLPGFEGEWEVMPLKNLISSAIKYGINASACDFTIGLPRYVRITDVSDEYAYSYANQVSLDHPDSFAYLVSAGDILVARTGATTGKSCLIESSLTKTPSVFAGFMIRIQTDETELSSKYLALFMQTRNYWKWVNENSMRSGQPGINSKQLSSLKISVPSLSEQTRLCEIFSGFEEEVKILKQELQKLKDQKSAVMHKLLTGEIRLPDLPASEEDGDSRSSPQ